MVLQLARVLVPAVNGNQATVGFQRAGEPFGDVDLFTFRHTDQRFTPGWVDAPNRIDLPSIMIARRRHLLGMHPGRLAMVKS